MSEPTKQQTGDGSDNFGQAAKQASKAVKQAGKTTANQAAAKGAEETAKAAAQTVKASVKAGKAVSNIAAGTAAGGLWGAAIAAAWSMRHTLFKILIAVCLIIVLIIVVVVSLPRIIFDSIFGSDNPEQTVTTTYEQLSNSVTTAIDDGYAFAVDKVEQIIADGKYDYELSMSALINEAKDAKDYDICYILAAYSVSMEKSSSSVSNLLSKLNDVSERMFTVTYVEKKEERNVQDGDDTKTETVRYVECTIHRFDEDVILTAFNIDLDAVYSVYGLTNREAIEYMANALKMTLFGSMEKRQAICKSEF